VLCIYNKYLAFLLYCCNLAIFTFSTFIIKKIFFFIMISDRAEAEACYARAIGIGSA
jgi:hypothetical protein